MMRRRKIQRSKKTGNSRTNRRSHAPRRLRAEHLESRQLLAGDVGQPLADITGLWVTVGQREYYTSDLASVTIDMYAGESLQVTGIEYGLDESYTPEHGVIAFESYVRREHGAAEIGSYDYTDGRFGDPVAEQPTAGDAVSHPGLDGSWDLGLVDNRIAVVAIRYFADESAIEDRMFVDVNVTEPEQATSWTEAVTPVSGTWQVDANEIAGDSLNEAAGLTVIETGTSVSQRFEVGVKAKTVQESTFANGFVVVDYRNENDFVYAGLRLTDNQWVIGHYDGNFNDLAILTQNIELRQIYDLRVAVDGSHLALAADGVLRVSHDFERTLDQGAIGLANQFAYTHFTEFHVFDNSATLAATPQQAYDEAVIAAQQADQASAAAIETAQQTAAASLEAESHATALESASGEADITAANATSAHAAAVQAVSDLEQVIQQAPTTIQAATLDQQSAATSVQELTVTLADAELVAAQLSQQSDAEQQSLNVVTQQHAVVQQAADDAVAASEAAAAAATAARAASDEAWRIYDESSGSSKKVRRSLKKAAQNAEKEADDADVAAQDAADIAADALQQLQSSSEQLAIAQQTAGQAAQAATAADDSVLSIQQSLDAANSAFTAASQTIEQTEAALATAQQQLPGLQLQVTVLAEEATLATAAAELAAQEATTARADADLAASEAESAAAEALRLAKVAETANQSLAAAELALQEAIAAEQAAIEQGEVSRVYSVNFNNQDAGAFDAVLGTTELVAGQLHLLPGQTSLAVSVLDDAKLPERTATRMYATVRADALPGRDQNGFIVFDYQSSDDFKYAGARAGTDQWVVGEMVGGQLVDLVTLDEVIGEGPAVEMQVWIEDSTLTLLVEGQQKIQHTFADNVHDGSLGLANDNARSRFDQVAVMQLYGGTGDAGLEEAAGNSDADPTANDAAINDLF